MSPNLSLTTVMQTIGAGCEEPPCVFAERNPECDSRRFLGNGGFGLEGVDSQCSLAKLIIDLFFASLRSIHGSETSAYLGRH